MEQFYGYRLDGKPIVLARVRGLGLADRIVANGDGEWEHYPDLDRLAFQDPDMNWDDLTKTQARAFLAEMGFPRSLADKAPA